MNGGGLHSTTICANSASRVIRARLGSFAIDMRGAVEPFAPGLGFKNPGGRD
jgi:hypothetical protein